MLVVREPEIHGYIYLSYLCSVSLVRRVLRARPIRLGRPARLRRLRRPASLCATVRPPPWHLVLDLRRGKLRKRGDFEDT